MKGKPLQTISLSSEVWESLLSKILRKVRVDSIAPYRCGYRERNVVYYTRGDDSESMVVKKMFLMPLVKEDYDFSDGWMQVVCVKRPEQKEKIREGQIGPIEALNKTNRVLKSAYSEEELEECYRSHEAEEEDAEILKYNILYGAGLEKDVIYKFTDCLYEDMNGAYNSKLGEIFPRCKSYFEWVNDHRHDDNGRLKNQSNYFVGCMTQSEKKFRGGKPTRKIHPKTRFWIVSEITKAMRKRQSQVGGSKLYVNTDGFIVQHPKKVLAHSDSIGDFKLESSGDVYFLRVKSGWCMQYMKDGRWEVKGSVPLEIRSGIDLSRGIGVDFRLEENDTGGKTPKDIKEKHYETIEIN